MDKRTTQKLEETLRNIKDESGLNEYLESIEIFPEFKSFHEFFGHVLEEKHLDRSAVIKDSGLERTYAYQILSGIKENPGKDKILRLCIAAKCTLNETLKALEIANVPGLYVRNRRDIILIYAIENGLSVLEANLLLDQYKENELA